MGVFVIDIIDSVDISLYPLVLNNKMNINTLQNQYQVSIPPLYFGRFLFIQ